MNERYALNDGHMEYAPDEGEWVHYSDYSKIRGEYQAQVHALQSRLESLEKDAGRYRWLRDIGLGEEWVIESPSGCCTQEHDSGSLDVAIDTAMQANKGE